MATNPNPHGALDFSSHVERLYAALACSALLDFRPALPDSSPGHEPSLGGKLLYAGSLDAQTRALLVAANIAGAASLAVSADSEASKLAIRDGVVDFLVNSLDEALRILKNEIRKRNPVAVCVATAPHAAEADFAREMLERGVRPDFPSRIEPIPLSPGQVLMAWSVASEAARWLPRLDALVLHCLDSDLNPDAAQARRWLRLAPRYLGRMARDVRVLRCDEQTAVRFQQEIREQVTRGAIGVTVDLWQSRNKQTALSSFAPPAR
jgi:urocanate hydratase